MDEDEARKKEARRTLSRIKGTLHTLQDDSMPEQEVEETEEYQRMKGLLEYGYSHNKPGLLKQCLILIKHPVFLVFFIIIVLMLLA